MSTQGPIEHFPFPHRLKGHVVSPGPRPRIHGYDVQGDLALRYSIAEQHLIALTGSAPDEDTGRAVEIALSFLAPLNVGAAPAHAGVLCRLCGATTSATIASVALALAEQARVAVQRYFDWVRSGTPSSGHVRAEELECLAAALPVRFRDHERVRSAPTLEIACLAILAASGMVESQQLEAALVWSRLPCAIAEAFAVQPGAFAEYPMDVPPFRYEEDQ